MVYAGPKENAPQRRSILAAKSNWRNPWTPLFAVSQEFESPNLHQFETLAP